MKVAKSDCQACHPGHHKYQEMLLAGEKREGISAIPSLMFNVKTNCLACHIEDKIVKGEKVAHGSGKACAACHTEKHEAMAKEWKDKTDEELKNTKDVEKEAVDAIKNAAGKASAEKMKEAKAMFRKGREDMAIVENGGGVHNKKYSIMLLDSAMNNFEDAIDLLAEGE
ncbi:MAG TPA: ammonia-forming cytochrome c nitrite reductase subunit c552 [Nitrospirae bacterium]|nr:ammonia-forming cytochrome c nitrite reductase subunit c552 [Nitrospirota bacterium]